MVKAFEPDPSKPPQWYVARISNGSGKVTLLHTDGRTVDTVIPESHRGKAALTKAHLKSVYDAEDAKLAKSAPVIIEKPKNHKLEILLFCAGLIAAAILSYFKLRQ